VHPVHLLLAMVKTITEKGSDIFEDSPVESWEHVGDHFVVRCRNGSLVHAQNLVLCPGLKSSDMTESSELSKLVVPVVGHVLVTEPSEYFAELVRNGGPVALWDTLQLYHYVRYLPDGRVLVGGEETPGVVPGTVLDASDAHIQKLYQWAQDHHVHALPPIQHCWKASLVVPADGLPLVKFRRLNNNFLVSAVTDGLPFGMLLGIKVARSLRTGSAEPVHMLSNRRKLVWTAKVLQALPVGEWVRALACKAAFVFLRAWDELF
jgi:glycine/D-amino acid oxidase-like deaminating enzyme